jgi:hypothetical protein
MIYSFQGYILGYPSAQLAAPDAPPDQLAA